MSKRIARRLAKLSVTSRHGHVSADSHTHMHREDGDLYTVTAAWQPDSQGQQVSPDVPLIGDVDPEGGHDLVILPPDGDRYVEVIRAVPMHPGGYMFTIWGDVDDVDATDGTAVEPRNLDRRESDTLATVVRADGGVGGSELFDTSEATFLEWRQRAGGEPPTRIAGPIMEAADSDAIPETGLGLRLQPLDGQYYAGITVLLAELDPYQGP